MHKVLSHGSPSADISEDMMRKIDLYEFGLLSPWSPQQMILQHEVGYIFFRTTMEVTD